MRSMFLPLVCLALVAGCASATEQRHPAVAGADGEWIAPYAPGAPGAVDSEWWRALHDPVLDGLVAEALAHNLDIAQAEAHLREARANRDAALGRTAPQLGVSGSATQQQVSANGQLPVANIPHFERSFALFDAGFDASWELDLWGGVASSVRAANARADAASRRADDTRLRIIAEVVRGYTDLRNAQARGQLLEAEAALRAEIAGLTDLRFRFGEASRSDAAAARQRADAARAQPPEAEARARAALYGLALLTGQPPEAMLALAKAPQPLPSPPRLVAAGIRSELLQRRPDVRAAEADLAAASADIGAERANLYPRFSLVGNLGQQARRAGDLIDGASTRFSVGPSLSWPVFSFGRIRAQVRAANARADAAGAAYEKSVLAALADSETAANRYSAALETLSARDNAAGDAAITAELANLRFQRGEDDRLQMLEARSAAQQAQQSRLAAQADALAAYAGFAKALGGGPAVADPGQSR